MIEELSLEKTIYLEEEDLERYGGRYSFLEQLRLGGVGSAKVVYESGIIAFDEICQRLSQEPCSISFELLKKGLIIRLYSNHHIRAVGVLLRDIEFINFRGTEVAVQQRGMGLFKNKIRREGKLWIITQSGAIVVTYVSPQNYNSVKAFFEKKPFQGLFNSSIEKKG